MFAFPNILDADDAIPSAFPAIPAAPGANDFTALSAIPATPGANDFTALSAIPATPSFNRDVNGLFFSFDPFSASAISVSAFAIALSSVMSPLFIAFFSSNASSAKF